MTHLHAHVPPMPALKDFVMPDGSIEIAHYREARTVWEISCREMTALMMQSWQADQREARQFAVLGPPSQQHQSTAQQAIRIPADETRTVDPTAYNTGYRAGRADAAGFRDRERLERAAFKQGFEAGRAEVEGLLPVEGVLGFCGWLMSLYEITRMGVGVECAPIAALIDRYRSLQNWTPARDGYERKIVGGFPSGTNLANTMTFDEKPAAGAPAPSEDPYRPPYSPSMGQMSRPEGDPVAREDRANQHRAAVNANRTEPGRGPF